MYHKEYSNFVRPTSKESSTSTFLATEINGETAKQLYLEEIGHLSNTRPQNTTDIEKTNRREIKRKRKLDENELSNLLLFHCVENNDVDKLRQALDIRPDKINLVDEFGWSLLMIACQANSVEIVKELLKHDIDINIRDKAGNSARSLVIKNRNFILADILLKHSRQYSKHNDILHSTQSQDNKRTEKYFCDICDNRLYEDKEEHLSSTVHNINASKGRKLPTNYVIPESNKGYQIMLRVGWDKEGGLGPDGSGKKYPIKAVQKLDKKGLGHKHKQKQSSSKESPRVINKKTFYREQDKQRKMEINFRREFY